MSRGRILFADNDPDFLRVRSEFLRSDYEVVEAHTLDEAKQYLQNDRIHLAILDLRMVSDEDERDISGLSLVRDENFRFIPKTFWNPDRI